MSNHQTRYMLDIFSPPVGSNREKALMNIKILHVLKKLSKDCDFKNVSAAQYRDENVRDSFISGLVSPTIRQRFLENKTLDLQTMVDQARALESSQISMRSFSHDNHQIPVAASLEKVDCCKVTDATVAASTYSNKQTCYFCGLGKQKQMPGTGTDV